MKVDLVRLTYLIDDNIVKGCIYLPCLPITISLYRANEPVFELNNLYYNYHKSFFQASEFSYQIYLTSFFNFKCFGSGSCKFHIFY